MGRNHLDMPLRFSLEYVDPPKELQRHVLALFHFACDEPVIVDKQPGALGQLALFARGEGGIEFDGVEHPVTGGSHMLSGFSVAAPYTVNGPWHAIGASLSPLGWASLTGKPANEYIDRFFPPQEILGPEWSDFAEQTNASYRAGDIDGREGCDRLLHWIAPRLSPVPGRHEELIEQTLGWLGNSLNPEVDWLFDCISYSRRQTERLVERYFGLPPAALARKYRAIRASALLAQPDLSGHAEAIIAEAFFDQPHMVREIRRYCGHTPTRLGGPTDPILHTMLQMKNFNRLNLFDAVK